MEQQLIVKEVEFQGSEILAIQNPDNEKIYVAVTYICNGIGLSEGQFRRQKQNLTEDVVLQKGITNLRYPTNGGIQEVLCIELDFLPLWLAKISITPKMQKDNPEVVNKLIEYQLKAKDILAEAFIHNKLKIPQTYKEALIALVETIEEKERLEQENQMMLPKVEKFDQFMDGDNYQDMNVVAKTLGTGRNKLFQFLRSREILMKNNTPYQRYQNTGYFVVKETPVQMGEEIVNVPKTYVTAKGVNFISDLLKENKLLH